MRNLATITTLLALALLGGCRDKEMEAEVQGLRKELAELRGERDRLAAEGKRLQAELEDLGRRYEAADAKAVDEALKAAHFTELAHEAQAKAEELAQQVEETLALKEKAEKTADSLRAKIMEVSQRAAQTTAELQQLKDELAQLKKLIGR